MDTSAGKGTCSVSLSENGWTISVVARRHGRVVAQMIAVRINSNSPDIYLPEDNYGREWRRWQSDVTTDGNIVIVRCYHKRNVGPQVCSEMAERLFALAKDENVLIHCLGRDNRPVGPMIDYPRLFDTGFSICSDSKSYQLLVFV